jgi:hypothetical protein
LALQAARLLISLRNGSFPACPQVINTVCSAVSSSFNRSVSAMDSARQHGGTRPDRLSAVNAAPPSLADWAALRAMAGKLHEFHAPGSLNELLSMLVAGRRLEGTQRPMLLKVMQARGVSGPPTTPSLG